MVDFSKSAPAHSARGIAIEQRRVETMFSRPDVALFVNNCTVGGSMTAHLYEDFLMISIVRSGQGTRRTIHEDRALQRGDVYITRPGDWHAYHSCRNAGVLNIAIGMKLLHRELGWLHHEPGWAYLLHGREPGRTRKQAMFRLPPAHLRQSMKHHAQLVGDMWPDLAAGPASPASPGPTGAPKNADPDPRPLTPRTRLIATLLMLLETVREGLGDQIPSQIPSDQSDSRIASLIDRLAHDLDQPWDLQTMARFVHLERSYFVRLFRRIMGLPPMTYLTQSRLDRAALLLVSTSMPVGEIGHLIGIDEPAALSRAFRQRFGQSPQRYRAATQPTQG